MNREWLDPVVSRWVRLPPAPRADAFAGRLAGITFDTATFRLEEPFVQSIDPTGRVTWRANGRVVTSGPSAVRFARVEVAITEWSSVLNEVTLRSRARHLVSWGERRERRYFDVAHRAATHIAAQLGEVDGRTSLPGAA